MKKTIPLLVLATLMIALPACIPMEDMVEDVGEGKIEEVEETEESEEVMFYRRPESELSYRDEKGRYIYKMEEILESQKHLGWELIEGHDTYMFPDWIAYAGRAEVRGWLEKRGLFGTEEMVDNFRIMDEDLIKMPYPHYKWKYYVIDEEMKEVLRDYSEENPARVVITEIRNIWESPAYLKIEEVKNNKIDEILEAQKHLNWELTTLDYLSHFPEISNYSGREEVRGWLVEIPVFGTGELKTHLRLKKDDLEKLPYPYNNITDYRIDETKMDLLKKYNEQNTAKMVVTEIQSGWESQPFLKIEKILTP